MVVSALADEVPVICSNYGGTKELVRKNGIMLMNISDKKKIWMV